MQALAIYILLRLDEGETDHNDFDSLLLTTLTVGLAPFLSSGLLLMKSFQITGQHITQSDIECNYSLSGSWTDWLYEESRRRFGFKSNSADLFKCLLEEGYR